MLSRAGIVLIILLSTIVALYGQQKIEGKIVDRDTGKPVPFASIGVMGTSKGTSSNLDGEFSLIIAGPISLKITCIGYESVWITSAEQLQPVLLKPIATQLNEIYIFEKAINPRQVVRKAFANISDNYDSKPFLQTYFYRNYCKDDTVYGRLVEAFIDVWKNRGYQSAQQTAGEKEEIRVTQLRRSIDQSALAQGHEPLLVKNVLQADLIAYQMLEKKPHVSFYDEVSDLYANFQRYDFEFRGITNYDGQEVYQINYQHKPDSILTTSGYVPAVTVKGSLFITTDTYAIIKAEQEKQDGLNTVRTSAYYRKYNSRYYPYHFVREGESRDNGNFKHWYHIELISVEISHNSKLKFTARDQSKADLLSIPYDSAFWSSNTILKATPVEEKIINDLGGGKSLNEQFRLYHLYELNTANGGERGEEKFIWLKNYCAGRTAMYVIFWSGNFKSYLAELEYAKRLNKQFRQHIKFVLISLESDQALWQKTVSRFNLFSDGIIHYRLEQSAKVIRQFKVNAQPAFILISKDGTVLTTQAKAPTDANLVEELEALLLKK